MFEKLYQMQSLLSPALIINSKKFKKVICLVSSAKNNFTVNGHKLVEEYYPTFSV